eukprot:CAMPEP_0175165712 /NCGR_PEP_ID=MMETSP0087-20121206/27252_1 /TAXON_ID=136419 /ORGANISM="Unknown Unknown, Strain D1" /LENGTH=158 /DNA_ID=CAMNT_0016455147 /DNA_START=144 /DNA_END=616 /DNA_ORIENTATION=+
MALALFEHSAHTVYRSRNCQGAFVWTLSLATSVLAVYLQKPNDECRLSDHVQRDEGVVYPTLAVYALYFVFNVLLVFKLACFSREKFMRWEFLDVMGRFISMTFSWFVVRLLPLYYQLHSKLVFVTTKPPLLYQLNSLCLSCYGCFHVLIWYFMLRKG